MTIFQPGVATLILPSSRYYFLYIFKRTLFKKKKVYDKGTYFFKSNDISVLEEP